MLRGNRMEECYGEPSGVKAELKNICKVQDECKDEDVAKIEQASNGKQK